MINRSAASLLVFIGCGWLSLVASTARATTNFAPCRIEIVEAGTGWPVPLVELRTTHQMQFFSDNAGVIACAAPELMGREVWFEVISNGYEVPKDGFGYRGVRLKPEPGQTLRVEVQRTIIAKRIGRITGAGLFAESQKTGRDLDWTESGVFGSDSVQNTVYRGKMYWLWGDTSLAHYPLGIFDCSSATSAIQPLEKFEPPLQLKLDYFTDAKGTPRGVGKMPGAGPTWLTAYVTLPDQSGAPHFVATYSKINPPLDAYEFGLCEWNDAKACFDPVRVLWEKKKTAQRPLLPEGPPAFWKDEQGRAWVMFGDPFPKIRFPATYEAWQDAKTWEALTPQAKLVASDGKPVKPHSGHVAWNSFRQRWVTVFMESFGKPSAFGELWYAEAPAPTGPWGKAVKILGHENYTFYNPRLHPEFTPTNSPVLLFEGTYTQTFANKPHPTPRYEYNQILYRLDLDDAALRPAQER
jgi:hypothetical protein